MELQSNEINELAKALTAAQAELEGVEKTGKNPHFKSSYSTLQACISVSREPLAKNNLALSQQMTAFDGKPYLVTTLLHSSGQWLRSYSQLILEKPTSQGMGSALTYMRRYALCAMLSLFQEDDDGNKASISPKKEKLTEDDYNAFIIEWSDVFTEAVVLDFIKTKASKFKITPNEVVSKERKDIDLFKKNVEAFIKWKEKNK